MNRDEVVAARLLSPVQAERLFLLELAKNEGLPRMMERLTFEGQSFIVSGVVDFGDGHGPLVLALQVDDGEPQAAPS